MIQSLLELKASIERSSVLKNYVLSDVLAEINYEGETYPLLSFTIGTKEPRAPVLFLTGGIHGLERIGAELALSFLKSTLERLVWDKSLQELLKDIRIVIIPLVNPVGLKKFKRSNGNNVDLMRNSPVEALEKTPILIGGQRISSKLPWYQGERGEIEKENKALITKFSESTSQSQCVLAVDFHSGFGMKDRIWFPFSYTRSPFDFLSPMYSLTKLFEDTHPYHIYKIEPQSHSYLISGDLWDHIFLEFRKMNPEAVFIPLTLEMGSWNWVKKNPLQIFSREGIFNPVKEHRLKRTFRRHNLLLEFLLRALYSHEVWSSLPALLQKQNEKEALGRWYDGC